MVVLVLVLVLVLLVVVVVVESSSSSSSNSTISSHLLLGQDAAQEVRDAARLVVDEDPQGLRERTICNVIPIVHICIHIYIYIYMYIERYRYINTHTYAIM